MPDPKPGDVVVCRVKEGRIVSSYAAFDHTDTFEVIATDYWGYYIYVPSHKGIEGGVLIDDVQATALKIKSRYIDCYMLYINAAQILSIRALDGCVCSRCKEFFLQAEPDAEGNFTCFLCRTYKWR